MLRIYRIEVTPFVQNCRVLVCDETHKAAVVDPGGEVSRIGSLLKQNDLSCEQIWLTHSHVDHCGGVAVLKQATGAQLYAHPDEKLFRERVEEICAMYGVHDADMQNSPEPENYIIGGEVLQLGRQKLEVLFTPGHAPGHVCFYNCESGTLVCGDTIFAGSIGRTDLPGADYETLIRSIKEVIFKLPATTRLLPGHGPDTTVQAEISSNPFLI